MSNLEDSPDHVVAFFLRLNIGRGRAINSFEVHGLVDVGVCPGLQPFILGAEEGSASIHRHGPAVALKGEGGSTTGLRFDPSFSCGGRDGRGSRNRSKALVVGDLPDFCRRLTRKKVEVSGMPLDSSGQFINRSTNPAR